MEIRIWVLFQRIYKVEKDFFYLRPITRDVDLHLRVVGDYYYSDLGAGKFKNETLKLKKSQGYYENHVIRLEDPCNILISEELKEELSRNNVTGWMTYDITVSDLKRKYFGFLVTGSSGPIIPPFKSGFMQRFLFDTDTWDLSDIFHPIGSFGTIITEKAKQVFDRFKIKNIEIEKIKNIELYYSKQEIHDLAFNILNSDYKSHIELASRLGDRRIIKCPSCSKPVDLIGLDITCNYCGNSKNYKSFKDIPFDSFLTLKLNGNSLIFQNKDHLNFIEDCILESFKEMYPYEKFKLIEEFPEWLKAEESRNEMLTLIDELKGHLIKEGYIYRLN